MSIALIGDGIVDNFLHLEHREQDLCFSLKQLGYQVDNYACENVSLFDIRRGFSIPSKNIKKRKYPYRTSQDEKCHPIHYLTSPFELSYPLAENQRKLVVLSVGGNDIRSKKLKIAFGVDSFLTNLLDDKFISEYRKIIEDILAKDCDLVLVSFYLPYLGDDSSYLKYKNKSEKLMEGWNNFIKGLASDYNLPVIDLSRTLDPEQRSHYSEDQTHMSNLSSSALARCIDYVYRHNKGFCFYYAENCGTHVSRHRP